MSMKQEYSHKESNILGVMGLLGLQALEAYLI